MQNKPYLKSLVTLFKPALIFVVIIVITAVYGFISSSDKTINFFRNEEWSRFPGAEVTKDGTHFIPLGRVITHQDGSVGQPNPPVNLSGTHLAVSGDFNITAVLSKIDKLASLRLYADPPIIYDKWRQESPSINVDVDTINNLITARIWDGSSSNSMDIRTYKILLTSKITLSLQHVKDQINFFVNNRAIGSMPDHNIFENGTIWFGTDGAIESTGWTLVGLSARAMGTGRVEAIAAPELISKQNYPGSLRNLADENFRGIKIGSTIAIGRLFTDEQYRNLAFSQFSIITPENSMKPEFIHPQENVYVFEEADLLVDAALKNNMTVHGHVLLYDKSTPRWMVDIQKEQRQNVMISHIQNVVSHFKGRVAEWDVVNEPFSQKNALYKNGGTGLEPNIWFEAMGEEYIDFAFRSAREEDPSAKLYLNDFGLERDGQRWDAFLSLIGRLKQRGVPIDGVGFEAHIYTDGDYINPEQLSKHMQILDDLGLLTRISEIDVTGDDPEEQINQYVTALDICLKESNCTSYTTWGITDLYGSTTRSDRYPLVYGNSLLWDTDMKAKPAYSALQNRLWQ